MCHGISRSDSQVGSRYGKESHLQIFVSNLNEGSKGEGNRIDTSLRFIHEK